MTTLTWQQAGVVDLSIAEKITFSKGAAMRVSNCVTRVLHYDGVHVLLVRVPSSYHAFAIN